MLEEQYKFDGDPQGRVYKINGVLISRPKVLRIYGALMRNGMANNRNALLYSIMRNSILTQDEVDKIIEAIPENIYSPNNSQKIVGMRPKTPDNKGRRM